MHYCFSHDGCPSLNNFVWFTLQNAIFIFQILFLFISSKQGSFGDTFG